ncbi:MAG: inositol monophosphatase [Verrucomicrobiota bacterium]
MDVPTIQADNWEKIRRLLCDLQDTLLATILRERGNQSHSLHEVAHVTSADVIYQIDKISEDTIIEWFNDSWPQAWSVEIVMEGNEDEESLTFPKRTPIEQTQFKCILDPIDGTRGIMYDKRSAWILGGIAPQLGSETSLQDIVVGAMTELPTTKQWRADQLSAVAGGPLISDAIDVRSMTHNPIHLRPSEARDFNHGFSAIGRFFPDGLELLARIEAELWRRVDSTERSFPMIFSDQYLSTGGQFYELMAGHDRFLADLRPAVFKQLGLGDAMTCHPYDIAFMPVLTASGVIAENPITGGPVDAPLDTTSPVCWAGYANADLQAMVSPHLRDILMETCPKAF